MSVHNGLDGTVITVTKEFLDDDDAPLMARAGYPQVRLRDKDKNLLSSVAASPSATPGEWVANVSVPNLGLLEKTEFRLAWLFKTTDGEKIVETDALILEPKQDNRVTDMVVMFGDPSFGLVLPLFLGAGDIAKYQVYVANTPQLLVPGDLQDPLLLRTSSVDRTHFQLPLGAPAAALIANMVVVDVLPAGALQSKKYTYKLWAVTPQIMKGMSLIEDFLNKSKIEQTIPELQYGDGDLLSYLERGLNLFNMIFQPTSFDGTNMQGPLLDAWITCSSYYALGAQLLAEGSLAFDFNGQGISLNVDRTPQLEAALGRIESQIDQRVVPLKKYLAQQGLTSGTGAVGAGNMNNPRRMGVLTVSNSPVTRLNGMSGYTGRRGWGW